MRFRKSVVSSDEVAVEKQRGVRKFSYEVDLDAKHAAPPQLPYKMSFEGPWSRHAVDTMLKHAIKGLKQFKREQLKEMGYVRGSSEGYSPTTSKRDAGTSS